MQKVKLQQSWYWLCPTCESDNYELPEIYVPDGEEDKRRYLIELGIIEAWEETPAVEGQICTYPIKVECENCQSTFESDVGE